MINVFIIYLFKIKKTPFERFLTLLKTLCLQPFPHPADLRPIARILISG